MQDAQVNSDTSEAIEPLCEAGRSTTAGTYTATYSPDDNKLRLYSSTRLPQDVYERVRAAGFRFAPKQDLFVAPMWTPDREDLLLELCGEVADEDQSLAERALDRAERFETYSDKRADDAKVARDAVSAITDHIPFGQPILIGHHSERRARRDAERIENGMRKAIRLWDTSTYWTRRAAGALQHAKYKQRPDVRARRIKTIEADHRKLSRRCEEAARWMALWERLESLDEIVTRDGRPTSLLERATFLAGRDRGCFGTWGDLDRGLITPEQARERMLTSHAKTVVVANRWVAHYENRLAYERTMLGAVGGIESDLVKPEKGGACICWASHRGGWSYIQKVNRVTVSVLDNWGNGGRNFTRTIPFDKLSELMSAADVQRHRTGGCLVEFPDKTGFALRVSASTAKEEETAGPLFAQSDVEQTQCASHLEDTGRAAESFQAMREQLKAGVTVVSAPQLFPTPRDLAARMVCCANLKLGQRILEPSAGTGHLVEAIAEAVELERSTLVAVKLNRDMAEHLRVRYPRTIVLWRDFLEISVNEPEPFDRIIMNPPFSKGEDVIHVEHALSLLRPDGVLVAIMSAGITFRQDGRTVALRKRIEERGGTIEALPRDTFSACGTSVATVLVVLANGDRT